MPLCESWGYLGLQYSWDQTLSSLIHSYSFMSLLNNLVGTSLKVSHPLTLSNLTTYTFLFYTTSQDCALWFCVFIGQLAESKCGQV